MQTSLFSLDRNGYMDSRICHHRQDFGSLHVAEHPCSEMLSEGPLLFAHPMSDASLRSSDENASAHEKPRYRELLRSQGTVGTGHLFHKNRADQTVVVLGDSRRVVHLTQS